MVHRVEIAFMKYLKQAHKYFGYECDPWRLARLFDLEVVLGEEDALNGKVITLCYDTFCSRRRAAKAIRHEIVHYLMIISGTEERILKLRCSYEEGLPTIERLSYHGELVLQMPDPILNRVCQHHGHTPAALIELSEETRAQPEDARRRWVYAEVGAARAAWVVRAGTVIDVVAANYWLPFWWDAELSSPTGGLSNALILPIDARHVMGMATKDRVSEPHVLVPKASLLRRPHGAGLLGVLQGGHTDDWYWDGA